MKKHALWPALSRWIVALVFIFSGFVKGVDPWGTAIKLGEYLRAFSMDWLVGAQFGRGLRLLRRCGEADQLADVLQEYSLVGFRVAALAGRSP